MAVAAGVPEDFKPQNKEELELALSDPMWRLNNLYFITIKQEGDDDDAPGLVVKFKMNRAQRRLAEKIWYRNIILKARQMGFTTFICILFLDYCLFVQNHQAGIIAHTDGAAKKIMSDKVKFAYHNLPQEIRDAVGLEKEAAEELKFSNGSSILVSTSMRSGTLQSLHISEFGKICARFPHRAKEIITGSIPTVSNKGIVFIESTAEGAEGDFYKMTNIARAKQEMGKRLSMKDYRFHFYAWYEEPTYVLDDPEIIITEEDHDYFDSIEAKAGVEISMAQRTWYIATRENDFSGDEQKMWQEYPSDPEEPFKVSSEGCYYSKQMTAARKANRIRLMEPVPGVPCYTCWDIGNSDGTAIWVIQRIGMEFRCIDFYEAWGEPYSHAVNWLQGLGLVWDTMYLPHDADHERQGKTTNKTPQQMLEELMPGINFEIVDRIEDVNWGIQQTRDIFPMLHFSAAKCDKGIKHLDAYKKKWNEKQDRWSDQPDKTGGHSEAADALRQFAQVFAANKLNIRKPKSPKKARRPNWKSA